MIFSFTLTVTGQENELKIYLQIKNERVKLESVPFFYCKKHDLIKNNPVACVTNSIVLLMTKVFMNQKHPSTRDTLYTLTTHQQQFHTRVSLCAPYLFFLTISRIKSAYYTGSGVHFSLPLTLVL